MRRFFFEPSSRNGDTVILSEEESRHIVKVLRLKQGDAVELLDGRGAAYQAVINSLGRRVEALIKAVAAKEADGGTSLWVWQGILKGEKMDTVVQKCTELGVSGIIPFQSSRCQGRLDGTQARKKRERWQRIGIAACKQSLRLQSIAIESPTSYADALNIKSDQTSMLRLLFWEGEKNTGLRQLTEIRAADSIALMLGPEGGFSREEVEQACLLGWRTVGLGERILRAETATLTAVSIVQYLAGNL